MRRPLGRPRLELAVLGMAVSLGCNHVHHECDCSPPPSAAVTPRTVTLASAGPGLGVENPVQPVAEPPPAREAAPTLGAIEVTAVAPASAGSSRKGTLVLSGADAEAMGIRPGHTPGARPVPACACGLPQPTEGNKRDAD